MIAPMKSRQPKTRSASPAWRLLAVIMAGVLIFAWVYYFVNTKEETDKADNKVGKIEGAIHIANGLAHNGLNQVVQSDDTIATDAIAIDEPKTNQWGNPAHWGHKKLRPSKVHRIDRSQLPLFEKVFDNNVDKTIAGLLVIEPGTDLIGEEIYDNDFVKRFLRSIANPIIVSRDDDDETKALKRAVIETKIELKERYDRGEDIAQILTDIRRELRELGAYREDIRKLIEEYSRNHNLSEADMKDYVSAANILLEERGAKPIIMPEFYYKQLEIRNQKIRALKGE